MPSITDWLMVIITGVYVIATIFICFANIKSARSAQKQTEEMQRQFYATNRPILSVGIVYLKKSFWALRFTNTGNQTAFNTRITLNQEFYDTVEDAFKEFLNPHQEMVVTIGSQQTYDLPFGTNGYRKLSPKPNIKVTVTYQGYNHSIYSDDFDIQTEKYAPFFSTKSELDDLGKKIDKQTNALTHIQRTLETISRNTKE